MSFGQGCRRLRWRDETGYGDRLGTLLSLPLPLGSGRPLRLGIESSLVESNVAQTLHLASAPHISARSGKGGILTVSVKAGSRERARQIDAEAVVLREAHEHVRALVVGDESRLGDGTGEPHRLLQPEGSHRAGDGGAVAVR